MDAQIFQNASEVHFMEIPDKGAALFIFYKDEPLGDNRTRVTSPTFATVSFEGARNLQNQVPHEKRQVSSQIDFEGAC